MYRWDPRRDQMPFLSDIEGFRRHFRRKYELKEWADLSVANQPAYMLDKTVDNQAQAAPSSGRYLEDLFDSASSSHRPMTSANYRQSNFIDDAMRHREAEQQEVRQRDTWERERAARRRSQQSYVQEMKKLGAKAPSASTDLFSINPEDDDAFFKLMKKRVSEIPAKSPDSYKPRYLDQNIDIIYADEHNESKNRAGSQIGKGTLEKLQYDELDSDDDVRKRHEHRSSTIHSSQPSQILTHAIIPSAGNPFTQLVAKEALDMQSRVNSSFMQPQNTINVGPFISAVPMAPSQQSLIDFSSSSHGISSKNTVSTLQAFPSMDNNMFPSATSLAPPLYINYAQANVSPMNLTSGRPHAWTVDLGTQHGLHAQTGTHAVSTTSLLPIGQQYGVSRTTTTAIPSGPNHQVSLIDTGEWNANVNANSQGSVHVAMNRTTTQASMAPTMNPTSVHVLDTNGWTANIQQGMYNGPSAVNVSVNKTTVQPLPSKQSNTFL